MPRGISKDELDGVDPDLTSEDDYAHLVSDPEEPTPDEDAGNSVDVPLVPVPDITDTPILAQDWDFPPPRTPNTWEREQVKREEELAKRTPPKLKT